MICCVKSFFRYRGSHKRIATETAIQIYNAIIQPHFGNSSSVWDEFSATLCEKMQKLQNRAARVVTKSDYDVSSMSADEKRIKKVKLVAEKRRSNNPRGNANNVNKFKTGDNQLFRGEYNVTYIYCSLRYLRLVL